MRIIKSASAIWISNLSVGLLSMTYMSRLLRNVTKSVILAFRFFWKVANGSLSFFRGTLAFFSPFSATFGVFPILTRYNNSEKWCINGEKGRKTSSKFFFLNPRESFCLRQLFFPNFSPFFHSHTTFSHRVQFYTHFLSLQCRILSLLLV